MGLAVGDPLPLPLETCGCGIVDGGVDGIINAATVGDGCADWLAGGR